MGSSPTPLANKLLASMPASSRQRIVDLSSERARRSSEALRLYRPLPGQDLFHRSTASERIVRGGNRSGKSTCAFVEVARAAMQADPHGKYPTKRPLLIYEIGYDLDHIGRVIFRMLFKPGAFQIIRDQATGRWRAFDPSDPADLARIEEAKESPALIPSRMVDWKNCAWENKRERQFSVIKLHNGTEIRAFSSKAEPAQGDPVDLIHIDEDIFDERWVTEMQARLSDRAGRMIWSAFPHSKNDALQEMSERASEQAHLDKPDVQEVVLTFSGNPYIRPDEKRKRIAAWTPEERRARDLGEFNTDSVLMYPAFNVQVHGVPRDLARDGLDEFLDRTPIPREWTHYATIDPGHSVCAVLLAAIPPPAWGDIVVCYDELYLRQCDASRLAREMQSKSIGVPWEAFVIDDHGSRVTQAGSGETIRYQYSKEFKRLNIASRLTKHGFIPGSDDVLGRCSAVRNWMATREDGTTKLRVVHHKLPNFLSEIRRYKKQIRHDEAQEKPVAKHNHLMNCLEYLAAYNPQYRPYRASEQFVGPAVSEFRAWMKKIGRGSTGCVHLGAGRN